MHAGLCEDDPLLDKTKTICRNLHVTLKQNKITRSNMPVLLEVCIRDSELRFMLIDDFNKGQFFTMALVCNDAEVGGVFKLTRVKSVKADGKEMVAMVSFHRVMAKQMAAIEEGGSVEEITLRSKRV